MGVIIDPDFLLRSDVPNIFPACKVKKSSENIYLQIVYDIQIDDNS